MTEYPLDESRPMHRTSPLWTDAFGRAAVRTLQFLIFAAATGLVAWLLTSQMLVTLPILVAIIFTCALQPVLRTLRNRGLGRIGSTILTFLGAILLLLGVFFVVVLSIYRQSDMIVTRAIEGANRLEPLAKQYGVPLNMEGLNQIEKSITGGSGSSLGKQALDGFSTAGQIGTGLILTLVLLFFFLLDGDRMWAFFKRFIPVQHRREAHVAARNSVKVLGRYVRGTMFIAAFAAIVDTIVMIAMGAPLAVPLGALIFFGAFVPILGALVTGLLATLVTLVTLGPVPALILVIAVIVVNQVEHHILQPKVMGDSIGLHGAVVLIALALGAHSGGIAGAVVAVPLTAVLWTIAKTLIDARDTLFPSEEEAKKLGLEPEESAGGSHAAPAAG